MSVAEPEVKTTRNPIPLTRGTGIAMVAWAAIGFFASFDLAVEKIKVLTDPNYQPSCNFNPVLSCGSVMKTDQASAFGFPNPYLGIAGFAVMVTFAVLVAGRVKLPDWFVVGGAIGSVLGAVFIHWLGFQSLYRIDALCPWCMVVWAVTMPLALWLTLAAITRVTSGRWSRASWAVWDWRFTVLAAWYLMVFVLILVRFWDYWSTHL